MAGYKVSYKILRQQGEDMKAVAKLVDGYSERVAQVSGKLGEGDLLAQVRSNLSKLREQLGESRTVMNMAGEFLVKTVNGYTSAEVRQVKKADSTMAHNRDFYKNPVVVASVGEAAGVAAAMPSPSVAAPAVEAAPAVANTAATAAPAIEAAPTVANTAAAPTPAVTEAPSGLNTPGAGAASALGGVAAAAGAVAGGLHLKKKRDAAIDDADSEISKNEYDPELELEKAIQRVRDLENEEA